MEKTDEQIARERDAVAAMTNAKANMTAALERVATLEGALRTARANISKLKDFISPSVYQYGDRSIPCRNLADDAIASIEKVLG